MFSVSMKSCCHSNQNSPTAISDWSNLGKKVVSQSEMREIFLLLGFLASTRAFYLPGVAPQDFEKGAIINIKVNKLSSIKTQLPYEFYSLPYCRPEEIQSTAENLGEVLRGDRIENSLYNIQMLDDESCKIQCRIRELSEAQATQFKAKILDEYRVNMILDNLPVAIPRERLDNGDQVKTYERGYPVGFVAQFNNDEVKVYVHNHLRFNILYHKQPETGLSRIVGFEVEPFSVDHTYDPPWEEDFEHMKLQTCHPGKQIKVSHEQKPQEVAAGEEIVFTYDVLFQASNIKWASRWDTYLFMFDDQIHWFSIVNSLMIVLFLSGMVAMIMMRTLHRDITKYNQLETDDDQQEETGWKLVHGDVFRPPNQTALLSAFVGTGVQIFGMTVITMAFAVLGFLSPSNRGGLMTAMLLLFVFMGLFAGYQASKLYKGLKGQSWKHVTLLTGLLFPAVCFVVFFVLNCLIWGQKSSGAVPFGTLVILCLLWFGISLPLVFIGSYFGYKKSASEDPVRTNKIPRQIPDQPWYMNQIFCSLVGGILPFGAVFIELFFILTSIWLHQFYYLFGFLGVVMVILVITCAEISIVLCYFQLCSEDYRWWWRAYTTAGASAFYLFIYSAFYFYTKLEIAKTIPMLMYFGYMFVISYGFFCLTGTIGFYACYAFVRTIYAAVKID
eukprot:TRINITY_DN1808_c0_g1_i2.p1 TRINITY_DN1808_c0_g1~~TRINITY_DN1808_c0_g1_i2.p1  ORF type:complete len:682 (-),score=91.71 TRINITY_DN1808_c0_g1_i2:217-2226(-)